MFGDALRARLEVLQTRQAGLQARLQDIARGAALRAVEEGRFYTLEHRLYNLKPNARWGEAYEQLADILYGPE